MSWGKLHITGLTLPIGYDDLGSYAFNTKSKAHKFCKTCGSSILIDFQRSEQGETDPAKDIVAVNVRFVFFHWILICVGA